VGITHLFVKKFKKIQNIVKIVAFRGNSGNSGGNGGGDRVLNSNHRGMGRGKTAGDLGERVPRIPRGIPRCSGLRQKKCPDHSLCTHTQWDF
jgi:hypothetical protein